MSAAGGERDLVGVGEIALLAAKRIGRAVGGEYGAATFILLSHFAGREGIDEEEGGVEVSKKEGLLWPKTFLFGGGESDSCYPDAVKVKVKVSLLETGE